MKHMEHYVVMTKTELEEKVASTLSWLEKGHF